MFVLPPRGADWPQGAIPATQTSVGIEDVDWAMLGGGEEAAAKAAGKRSAASKRRQAIFTLSDDDAEEREDADTTRLVPRKKRRQLESTEQGASSIPVGPTSPTTATRRTSDGGVEHQGPATVLDVEGDQESPTQHVEQARPKRRAFATSFHASNM